MKPVQRWPLHPAPKEGEAMSSWLHRIAKCYTMRTSDLIEYDLGCKKLYELDLSPSILLLTRLSERSGINPDSLRLMTLAGWAPWLFDSLEDTNPFAFEMYVHQFSVLLEGIHYPVRSINNWQAWLPKKSIKRACPLCLKDTDDQAIKLVWSLPLMLSCPEHGCWLESYWGTPGDYIGWDMNDSSPRVAKGPIAAMDRRTWQALTEGYVELPRERVHAAVWFRLLRTLLHELNTPMTQCGSQAKIIRSVWQYCGYPTRAGQKRWYPYEVLDLATQLQMLEAAATAIHMIESTMLVPQGKQTILFLPESQAEVTNGLQSMKKPMTMWQEVFKAVENEVIEARYDPETALSLFNLASRGKKSPEEQEKLRVIFANVGIPREFLSHGRTYK